MYHLLAISNFGDALFYCFLIIVMFLGIFFLIRKLNMWYWRIDERFEQQQLTNTLLQRQSDYLSANQALLTLLVQCQLKEGSKIAMINRQTGKVIYPEFAEIFSKYKDVLQDYDISVVQ